MDADKTVDGTFGLAPVMTPVPTAVPTAVPTPSGPAPTGGLPRPLTAKGVFALPAEPKARTRCAARKTFRIRVTRLTGVTYKTIEVRVNGRRVKRLTGERASATVVLRRLSSGRLVVKVSASSTDGRTVSTTRRYRACPKR